MKELLELIVSKSLPEGVEFSVNEAQDEFGNLVLELKLPDEHRGRIIGKEGKNINSIRQILSVIARQQNTRVNIKIVD